MSIALSIDLNSIYYLPDWVCHPTIIDRNFLFQREGAEQGRGEWGEVQRRHPWATGVLQQRDRFARSAIKVRCSRCEAPKPYISNNDDNDANNDLIRLDNLNDGTEDTNHNGRIDGDNGDGIYSESETWSETSPNLQDTDGDSFSDKNEKDWGYNPLSKDTDSDGLLDSEEDKLDSGTRGTLDAGETDPTKMDTDGDGLEDLLEVEGWMVTIISEATGEIFDEYICTSNPRNKDFDGDGLNDNQEYINGTDSNKIDTDGDGKTDYEELEGDFHSSATGIDGEPPEIWHYDCKYEIKETQLLLLKVPSGLEVWMEVGARDIFGIDNIEILITGLEDKKVYTDNDDNVTVEFEWELSGIDEYKRAFFDGFKINVTATDRNGNVGFRNEKLDSIKDIVLSAFIGPLTQLVDMISNFLSMIMELARKVINKLIEGVKDIITQVLDKILSAFQQVVLGICCISDDSEQTKGSTDATEEDILYIDLFLATFALIFVASFILSKANAAAQAAGSALSLGSLPLFGAIMMIFITVLMGVVLACIAIEKDTEDEGDDTEERDGIWGVISLLLFGSDLISLKLAYSGSQLTASAFISKIISNFKIFFGKSLFSSGFWVSPYNPFGDWIGVIIAVIGVALYLSGILISELVYDYGDGVDVVIATFSLIMVFIGWWISLKLDDTDITGGGLSWVEEVINSILFGFTFICFVKEIDDLL